MPAAETTVRRAEGMTTLRRAAIMATGRAGRDCIGTFAPVA
jgi:hypothetical protein